MVQLRFEEEWAEQIDIAKATGTVLAFDPARQDNASLMVDVCSLGYLRPNDDRVLDATYGWGLFWSAVRPRHLVSNDLNPDLGADLSADFTALPFPDRSFDVVVFDPPYKLNGTPTDPAVDRIDERYGVHTRGSTRHRLSLIEDGATECARVSSRVLLVKCQDQVAGGVYWQTHQVANLLASTFRLADELYVMGYRVQPDGVAQHHARRNYSTLCVFKRRGRQ